MLPVLGERIEALDNDPTLPQPLRREDPFTFKGGNEFGRAPLIPDELSEN